MLSFILINKSFYIYNKISDLLIIIFLHENIKQIFDQKYGGIVVYFKRLFSKRIFVLLSILIIIAAAIIYTGNMNRTRAIVCASISRDNVPQMETIQDNNDYYIVLKDLGNIKLRCSKAQYDYIEEKNTVYYIEYETDLFSKSQGKVIIITDKNIMGIPK